MKLLIVDYRISENELSSLLKMNYNVLFCPQCTSLYEAIDGHPDIQFFCYKDKVITHPKMIKSTLDKLKLFNVNYTFSNNNLDHKYPYDIILNCFVIGDLFVHNIKYTDSSILDIATKENFKKIYVPQGYTKCSTAIISDKACITSDKSIYKALTLEGIDVLLLPPGDISLPNLDYGFIGGTCGLIEDNLLAFFGSLNEYKYGDEVKAFLKKHNLNYIYLHDGKLIDRGSILSVNM